MMGLIPANASGVHGYCGISGKGLVTLIVTLIGMADLIFLMSEVERAYNLSGTLCNIC